MHIYIYIYIYIYTHTYTYIHTSHYYWVAASDEKWAATFIPMPMPKIVCRTNSQNKSVQ